MLDGQHMQIIFLYPPPQTLLRVMFMQADVLRNQSTVPTIGGYSLIPTVSFEEKDDQAVSRCSLASSQDHYVDSDRTLSVSRGRKRIKGLQ